MNDNIRLTISALVSAATISSGQPALMTVGAITASTALTSTVIEKRTKRQIEEVIEYRSRAIADRYDELSAEFERAIVCERQATQRRLEKIDREISSLKDSLQKIEKQTRIDHTTCRLMIGKLQKLQVQQKVTSRTLTQQQQQLDTLHSLYQKSQNPVKAKLEVLPSHPTKAHVAIDGANITMTAKSLGLEIDWYLFKTQLLQLATGFDECVFKYYTGIYNNPSTGQLKLIQEIERENFELVTLPINNFGSKVIGDDVAITVDSMDSVRHNDLLILASGDGDFIPLIQKLITTRNVKVIVIGGLHQTNKLVKEMLQENFISLESISHKISKPLAA
jgi:uncharacterized LabA/DUF88 family protein